RRASRAVSSEVPSAVISRPSRPRRATPSTKYRAVEADPSPTHTPDATGSTARSAAARLCASISVRSVGIYLIESRSGRIRAEPMNRIMSSVPGRVLQKFLEDQAPNWAVLIAWNALFAMFPIVIFAAGILGLALSIFGIPSKLIYTDVFSAIPGPGAHSGILKALTGA